MQITHLNPANMHQNPAFSQAITVEGAAKLVFVGGQNGIDADGELVAEDLGAQSEQALENVLAALEAAGASQQHVLKLTISMVQGEDVNAAYAAAQKIWGPHPTTITVLLVAGLALPGALVEIDAIAAL